ncbi:class I SAM-dependent methyltransferase [Streptomyces johnsoniae]|uniref:Class I SAM-dependent methyltransferase n=1 Tax=Streptomyces johnsoniae TaxID=3075532 RepID=A0ABU2RZS4_9ACTN|nr:class I SAM-dependent methyltransferase [Streptomyces sp. DSM 41886]MDT0442262.1 class I SAM-dependent methyltransferase [Streptomyces sp. DSM 41886]
MSSTEPNALTLADLYDGVAELYDECSAALEASRAPFSTWMSAHLPRGKRALDIGCGAGRHTTTLAELFDEVLGTDPAPTMIDIAQRDRARPNVTYQVRDALDMTPEKDGTFDLVFAFSCVFLMGEPRQILPHLAALVAPGGTLVISDPENMIEPDRPDMQADLAFKFARVAYDVTGRVENSVKALKLFMHENWGRISEQSTKLSHTEFVREYSAALPGVEILDDVWPGMQTARWHKPAV